MLIVSLDVGYESGVCDFLMCAPSSLFVYGAFVLVKGDTEEPLRAALP